MNPHSLAEALGVTLFDGPAPPVDGGHSTPIGATAPEPGCKLNGYPTVLKALAQITGDRSEDIARVVGACLNAGLTVAQAQWVVRTRTDLTDKLAELSHDDVERLWLAASYSCNQKTNRLSAPPNVIRHLLVD